MPKRTIREVVDNILEEYDGRHNEKYILLTLYRVISEKDILQKISSKLIPNIDGNTMEQIGSKMEKIDPQYAVKQYLTWIHSHVTRSHTYYLHAAKFIGRIKELLFSINKQDMWFSIVNEIYQKYGTRKKFLEKVRDYL